MLPFFFALLIATEMIDLDMTPQAKKKTGIYKLSDKEKEALQVWIDRHYEKRFAPLPLTNPKGHPTIQENLKAGRFLRLSDESLWRIHPSDVPIVLGWMTPVEILIADSKDSAYPKKLINSLTGSPVRARQVSEEQND